MQRIRKPSGFLKAEKFELEIEIFAGDFVSLSRRVVFRLRRVVINHRFVA